MSDVRTLGEIAARPSMLHVACWRCERRDRYRCDMPIDRHGSEAAVRVIVLELIGDCPRRDNAALVERCDILFPEVRTLFPLRRSIGIELT